MQFLCFFLFVYPEFSVFLNHSNVEHKIGVNPKERQYFTFQDPPLFFIAD